MDIKFNKKIYTKKAVADAICEFKHLADFSVKNAKDFIVVGVENIDQDVGNVLQDEFCNYVLFLMNRVVT